MKIYIDESGNFIPGAATSRICCIAALAVPSSVDGELTESYRRLLATWTDAPEVKGSSLSEDQIAEALELFGRFEITATIAAIDAAMHTADQIRVFRAGTCSSLRAGLTDRHNAASRTWVEDICREIDKVPEQLYIQLYLLILTIEDFIRYIPLYLAQRRPLELGRFDWTIDPKEVGRRTRYEESWRQLVCPILQSRSIEEPMGFVEGVDYSAFDRFLMKETPEYLTTLVKPGSRGIDLMKLLRESVDFPDSRDCLGLQIVDVVASAFTGVMNGRFSHRIWPLVGRLLVQPQAVRFVAFGAHEGLIRVSSNQHVILSWLKAHARPMIPN